MTLYRSIACSILLTVTIAETVPDAKQAFEKYVKDERDLHERDLHVLFLIQMGSPNVFHQEGIFPKGSRAAS